MKVSRREFLKLSALGFAGLTIHPSPNELSIIDSGDLGRISYSSVSVYSQPWDQSRILFQRFRDDLVHIYYPVISDKGPTYNPLWYRVWGGYIHSTYVQRVSQKVNPVLEKIPQNGQLAEVTVPFAPTYRYNLYTGWKPLYRLYYESVQWIRGIDEGPDGSPWYRLYDELLRTEYHVAAPFLRPINDNEITPISPEVAPEKKRIEISLARQSLTAYEDDIPVMTTRISSGVPKPGKLLVDSTETPKGKFYVQSKMPSKHMGDGHFTNDPEAYELPGVPWVCFFETTVGIALHGTWWHNNFGVTMSRGCINLRCPEAKWLFRWTTPVSKPNEVESRGIGTVINIT